MARTSKQPNIDLTEDQKHELEKISRSRTAPVREVERAAIILRYSERESIVSIQKGLGVSRPTIFKCIISKETMAYLKTRPNRFVYVHTPKHGSWLNLVETLFGKMARTFLRHIRVDSKAELKERIMRGIAEINASPVVHRWSKFGESSMALM